MQRNKRKRNQAGNVPKRRTKRLKYNEDILYQTLLNVDLLHVILLHLYTDEILTKAAVCKTWSHAILEGHLVQDLYLSQKSQLSFIKYYQRFAKGKINLNLISVMNISRKMINNVNLLLTEDRLNSLHTVILKHLPIASTVIKIFGGSAPLVLNRINIVDCCVSIQQLPLIFCFSKLNGINVTSIEEHVMQYLKKQNKGLCVTFKDFTLVHRFKFNDKAGYLSITLRSKEIDVTLEYDLPSFRLKHVFTSRFSKEGCFEIDSIDDKNLRELHLTNVSDCEQRSIQLKLKQLKNLHIQTIGPLTLAELQLPALQSCKIDVVGNSSITLKSLSQLKSMDIVSPRCKDFRLTSCNSPLFTGAYLNLITQQFSHFLHVLMLSKMDNLDELNIDHLFSLKTLAISDCNNLKTLCCSIRTLKQLYICNCKSLTKAKFLVSRKELVSCKIAGIHPDGKVVL